MTSNELIFYNWIKKYIYTNHISYENDYIDYHINDLIITMFLEDDYDCFFIRCLNYKVYYILHDINLLRKNEKLYLKNILRKQKLKNII